MSDLIKNENPAGPDAGDGQEQQPNGVTPEAGNTDGTPAGEQQEPVAPTAEDVEKLKAALAKERSANKLTAKELATLKAERDAQNKTPEEQQIEAARREGETAAEKRANERLVKAELKAAAKGKLTNTADALVFIDLSSIEVGDDGEVDADALETAIDNLLTERPYLGAATPKRFSGGVDQGGGKSGAPKQLTRAELANMSPEAIVAAEEKGQLANIYKTGS